jgi:periplasmic protein TonB
MSPALFRSTPDIRPESGTRRLSALPVSIALHVLAVFALVVIPLLATDVLPAPHRGLDTWVPVVTAPQPPPLPAPRATARVPSANSNAAPVDAPKGITPDTGLVPTSRPADGLGPQPGVVDGGVDGGRLLQLDPPPPPPAPAPTTPYRPGTLIRQPVKLVDVSPVYPDSARTARIEGVVIIEAVIGPTGDVREARVLRSRPLLDEAALTAVRQWKFTPTLLNGVPVPVVMTVTVNFTLR